MTLSLVEKRQHKLRLKLYFTIELSIVKFKTFLGEKDGRPKKDHVSGDAERDCRRNSAQQ